MGNFKRAYRISKIIGENNVNNEESLRIERIIQSGLDATRDVGANVENASKRILSGIKELKAESRRYLKEIRTEDQSLLVEIRNETNRQLISIEDLVKSELAASASSSASRLFDIERSSKTTAELIENIRNYVAKQADEVKRWQEGYDWRITKNFLLRLIGSIDEIEDKIVYSQKDEKLEALIPELEFMLSVLTVNLEEEGLIQFTPSLGSPVDASRVEVIGTLEAEEPSDEPESVASIFRKGYEYDLGNETKIIRKAKARVFKKKAEAS